MADQPDQLTKKVKKEPDVVAVRADDPSVEEGLLEAHDTDREDRS